jgi:hypothetical protein
MATRPSVTDVEDEDLSNMTTAEFYASAKHQAIRKWLGIPKEPRELPPWTWVPNDDWRKLRGILSDHPEHDTTEMKARNRAEEMEHDERKFGPFPRR